MKPLPKFAQTMWKSVKSYFVLAHCFAITVRCLIRSRKSQNYAGMNALSNEELIKLWRTSEKMEERDRIVESMKTRGIYPQEQEDTLEEEGGLYPSTEDPLFLQKLLRKQEFAENKQLSVAESIRRGIDPCKGLSLIHI